MKEISNPEKAKCMDCKNCKYYKEHSSFDNIYIKIQIIARIKIETLDKQYIKIIAYNSLADFVFSKLKKLDYVFINGFLCENYIIAKLIKKSN